MSGIARALAVVRETLRGLLFGGKEDAATREEMQFHLEMEAERLVREEGLDPAEARRRAAVAFGGVEKHREATRDARGFGWLTGLSLDLRLGARMLRKHPGLTVIGGLGMAVGVALSVGFFAFTLAHIYPEIPLEEGDRIVALENRDVAVNNEERQSLHDFFTWRDEEYLGASLRAGGPDDGTAAAPWERGPGVEGEEESADPALVRFGERVTELVRRLEAEPAVAGVTFTSWIPGHQGRVRVEGMPAPAESPAGHRIPSSGVWQGYFDLFEARVLAGRAFEPGDFADGATAVVVTQTFASRVLDGGDAVGRRIRWVDPQASPEEVEAAPERWHEIVGVVEDRYVNRAAPEEVRPVVYYPVAPGQGDWVNVVVRVKNGGAGAFSPRLREVAAAVDPGLRVGRAYVMAEAYRQERLAFRLVALGVVLVLLSVLLLSGAGVYAMMSFTVTQRRGEIGIRSALGAQPWQVLRSVLSRAGLQIGLGIAAGLVVAVGIELASDGGLMGGRGPVILPIFAAAMALVGMLAAWGPARRGLRVPPAEVLRAE